MGFDLYAEKGGYFRNSIWSWRPLWEYIVSTCREILADEDIEQGTWNNGHPISGDKALDMAERLHQLLLKGDVAKYAKAYKRHLESLPLEECHVCSGIGTRNDQYVQGKCNGCSGNGRVKQFDTHYPFSEENIREFATFCRDSGGFSIY